MRSHLSFLLLLLFGPWVAGCSDPAREPAEEPVQGTGAPAPLDLAPPTAHDVTAGAGFARPEVPTTGAAPAGPEIDPRWLAPEIELVMAPDSDELPDFEGVVRKHVPAAEAGIPDPSFERLESRESWEGQPVEFFEEQWPDGSLRRQAYRYRRVEGDEEGAEVLHGPEWRWFQNGQIELRRTYRHGQVHGPFVDWFPSGLRKSEGEFVDDLAHGRWLRWHTDGLLRSIRTFEHGRGVGLQWVMHDERRIKTRSEWVDGYEEGFERAWNKRGWPMHAISRKRGKLDGPRLEWHAKGVLATRRVYRAGTPHGDHGEWYSNGMPRLIGRFHNGNRIGEWRLWNEKGQLMLAEHYERGKFDGLRQVWTEDGILVFDGDYTAGRQQGLHRIWYTGGNPKEFQTFEDGVSEGPMTTWHPNGQKASEGRMGEGLRQGPWTLWNEEGEVLEAWSGVYEDGQLVDAG